MEKSLIVVFSFMEMIYQFFNHPFFIVVGGISTLIAVGGLLLILIFWFLGITPLLWRLGLGRWLRKIAIAANDEIYNRLRIDLVDSGIFREGNISQISKSHLSKVKDYSLILVHYQSFAEEEIRQLLDDKKSASGMVFYFPEFNPSEGKKIPDTMVQAIGKKENTTVVNFRGRLLNDIITTLITTSYEKR
ncbi:MAG: hypothetical protein KKD35_06650 [Elusimicrobia bacterium]|nr:hypothetical protein [Elusimicrobiota bacterium]